MKRAAKLAILNIALILLNIIIFSKAFIGLDVFGQGAVITAFSVMWIFLTVAVFFYGNYKILCAVAKPKPQDLADTRFETLESCQAVLAEYIKRPGVMFDGDLTTMRTQLERMGRKENTITDILLQKFQSTELSYVKFQGQIESVKKIMCLNTRNVLNRLYAFDESEYVKSISAQPDDRHSAEKRELLNEYRDFVKQTVDNNEDILIKMDRLILEISKLNDSDELNNTDTMKELDALIQNTQLYK